MSTTKVMSLSSTSGTPTPPNPTPYTDSATSNENVAHPDFDAVGRILGPIQEDLNERADFAMLPSPPINTPEAFSPAPSVFYRPHRSRGFSLLGDRLAMLKLHECGSPRGDSDCASSNRSIVTSVEDEAENIADDESSTGRSVARSVPGYAHSINKNVAPLISPTPGAIPIALGSARLNPRIEEYIMFSSKDLPVTRPAKGTTSSTQAIPANNGSHTRGGSFDTIKSEGAVSGVTEKSTWAEEIEENAERAFLRLEQLAYDECVRNPRRSMEEHYTERLQRLLAKNDRKVKLKISYETSTVSSASASTISTQAPTEVPEDTADDATAEAVAKE
ncbi:hypothetical protein DPSP01_008982 [Paraphaeosphaeria sporulosa]|uniref:Uncharacterized protein n=1 Tax=Paraphaeosphaeria sporulosa TaxID=1460663 RepID=A0A177C724_9PLEO|nr:uncharacterized protein CC84DRAFT_840069 [Paraphaeosphaeria sporulosa]OAG03443.1 hypothetical protein CC84DRAFT_840069 [Paraphaeosphaeria sporulosa]